MAMYVKVLCGNYTIEVWKLEQRALKWLHLRSSELSHNAT